MNLGEFNYERIQILEDMSSESIEDFISLLLEDVLVFIGDYGWQLKKITNHQDRYSPKRATIISVHLKRLVY